ncbi:ABC transporter permease subunit [Spirillospora sp. NPDC048911]|uniref:ABC transporter permease subunit n=1 Tax=Spirillospora sp. NPDC048911 TaxID=3364527 RepID=UPI00371B2BE6
MPRNAFTKTLWDNRRVLVAWITATTLVALMYSGFYPQISGGSLADAADGMPASMREAFNLDDLTSAAGYLQSSPFGILVPLLVMFYGAATGARMISADEESGYLDLLLAHPLGRTRLLLQRFAALATGSVLIAGVVLLSMLAIRGGAELDAITPAQFTAQCLSLALLSITFGALAIALGAAFSRGRALVFGVTGGAGVLAYAVNSFAPVISAGWLRKVSPFYYYIGGEPLKNGFQWGHLAILAAISLILVTAGTWTFNRRDIAA